MILNYIHRQKITFDTFTQYLMQYFNTTSLFSLHYMHHFLMFNKLNLLQITMCKKKLTHFGSILFILFCEI